MTKEHEKALKKIEEGKRLLEELKLNCKGNGERELTYDEYALMTMADVLLSIIETDRYYIDSNDIFAVMFSVILMDFYKYGFVPTLKNMHYRLELN